MKKFLLIIVAVFGIVAISGCSTANTVTTTTTAVTTVDTDNFIEITTADQLAAIEMNKSYRLMADIDLTGQEWVPLGTYSEPYLGIFDGNGHTISNLTISERNDLFNGLFAHFAGTVTDLSLADVSINYAANYLSYAGGFAGYFSGDATNVTVSGQIIVDNTKSNTYVGMFVGMSTAKITRTMTADQFVANVIDNVKVSGTIDATSRNFLFVGGLAGKVYNTEVKNCYADTTIDASSLDYRVYAGGLIGHHYGGILVGFEEYVTTSDIPITGNIALGTINAISTGTYLSVGGFFGYTQYGIIENNVAAVDITATGDDIYASAFAGEFWIGTITSVLGTGTITITPSEGLNLELSSLAGFVDAETSFTDSYYLVTTDSELQAPQGTEATLVNLQTEAWYSTWLDWANPSMTLTELAASFSE